MEPKELKHGYILTLLSQKLTQKINYKFIVINITKYELT